MVDRYCQLLKHQATGQPIPLKDLQQLADWELEDEGRSAAFGISCTNVTDRITRRSHLWQLVYPEIYQFCQKAKLTDPIIIETLWKLWLPLGIKLAAERQKINRPLVRGVLGLQGTGKTTLGYILALILKALGYKSLNLSLDDLYKTHAERQRLQAEDSRFVWRGPPGTHDLELGITVLDQLRHSKKSISIPRFDKSLWRGKGDRIEPELVENIDIVLFEGWFVGVQPIDNQKFESPPPPIQTASDRAFAREINQRLTAYLPLWERLDRLLVLYPTDYRFSKQWRQQAEQQAISSGKSGMTDSEVDAFVDYFWRSLHPELFVKPLLKNPQIVDLAIEINSDRAVEKIYPPQSA